EIACSYLAVDEESPIGSTIEFPRFSSTLLAVLVLIDIRAVSGLGPVTPSAFVQIWFSTQDRSKILLNGLRRGRLNNAAYFSAASLDNHRRHVDYRSRLYGSDRLAKLV